jgi:hypothetical protein
MVLLLFVLGWFKITAKGKVCKGIKSTEFPLKRFAKLFIFNANTKRGCGSFVADVSREINHG